MIKGSTGLEDGSNGCQISIRTQVQISSKCLLSHSWRGRDKNILGVGEPASLALSVSLGFNEKAASQYKVRKQLRKTSKDNLWPSHTNAHTCEYIYIYIYMNEKESILIYAKAWKNPEIC